LVANGRGVEQSGSSSGS